MTVVPIAVMQTLCRLSREQPLAAHIRIRLHKYMHNIEQQLIRVRERINLAIENSDRADNSVCLLAVSKTKPAASLRQAYAAGQRSFAENYLQEALSKQQELSDLAIEWHFIGPIQSNKTKSIAENFDWVHTLDRAKIAQRLNDQRPGDLEPLNCCIQVNIDAAVSKSGVAPNEVGELLEFCDSLPHLSVRGLMCIPNPSDSFAQQCRPFVKLGELMTDLKRRHGQLDTLSMGMSQDLEAAVTSGATIVRVGTDIFGKRG